MHEHQDDGELLVSSGIELYDRYASIIFAYVRLNLGSYEDAEDVTIEVFITALEHDNLSTFTESQKLAWLRRVAHNRLVDRYRYADRHPNTALDQIKETLKCDDENTPEQVLLRVETSRQCVV
jgi:RNA polymerase sigma-70 factor, ECF subfamily